MKQILVAYALFGLAASTLTGLVLLVGEYYSWLFGVMILSGITLSICLIYRGRSDNTQRAGEHGPEFAPKSEELRSRDEPISQQKRKEAEMTQNANVMSPTENMRGAVFTVLASVMAVAVFGYVHHLLLHGVPPTIAVPFADGLQPEAAKVASEAARIVTIPIVLLSLWAGISRLAAHTIPSWKFFWYMDFVPSILLFGYLLLVVPFLIWATGYYKLPNADVYIIWGSFLFGSFVDIFANGRHRTEHPQAPFSQGAMTYANNTNVGGDNSTSNVSDAGNQAQRTGISEQGIPIVPMVIRAVGFIWDLQPNNPQNLRASPVIEHHQISAEPTDTLTNAAPAPIVEESAEPVQAH